jgi:hypothetical protein
VKTCACTVFNQNVKFSTDFHQRIHNKQVAPTTGHNLYRISLSHGALLARRILLSGLNEYHGSTKSHKLNRNLSLSLNHTPISAYPYNQQCPSYQASFKSRFRKAKLQPNPSTFTLHTPQALQVHFAMDSIAYQTSLILEFATRKQSKRLLRREWGPMWRLGVMSSEETAAFVTSHKTRPEVATCLFPGLFEKEPVVKIGWIEWVLQFVKGGERDSDGFEVLSRDLRDEQLFSQS